MSTKEIPVYWQADPLVPLTGDELKEAVVSLFCKVHDTDDATGATVWFSRCCGLHDDATASHVREQFEPSSTVAVMLGLMLEMESRLGVETLRVFFRSDTWPKDRTEQYARGKLSDDDVRDIRAAYAKPLPGRPSTTALARLYGVSQSAISKVVRRQSYQEVE